MSSSTKLMSDVIAAAAYKELVAVDLPDAGSNQHELNGVIGFKQFFGTDERVDAEVLWSFHNGDDHKQESGRVTFYDARERDPKRSEWRLYYSGTFLSKAESGDCLVMLKLREEPVLRALVFKRNAATLGDFLGVAGLDPRPYRESFGVADLESLSTLPYGDVEARILREAGIEYAA